MFVTKRDRFERKDSFTCLVHRLDLILETLRGGCPDAKLTVRVDPNWCPCRHCSIDPRDIGFRLGPLSANADHPVIADRTSIANINIVVALGNIDAGVTADGDVPLAGGIVYKRLRTHGCIVIAVVMLKRSETNSHAAVAGCSARLRLKTHRRVPGTGGTIKEGVSSLGSVIARIASVRCRRHRLHRGRKPKASEQQRNENENPSQRRRTSRICSR